MNNNASFSPVWPFTGWNNRFSSPFILLLVKTHRTDTQKLERDIWRFTLIDLFIDTAAILNLLDLWNAQGELAQYLRSLFWQKENFTVYFSGKKAIIITSKLTAQRSFFSHYNLFLGKLKEKSAQKARVNTERVYRILLMPPSASHNTL